MINSKRGVESVEVWMWVIAGLIIGTIVFGGSYMLFSHWIENNELKETKVNFELLTQSIVKTCNQGTDKLEISRFVDDQSNSLIIDGSCINIPLQVFPCFTGSESTIMNSD